MLVRCLQKSVAVVTGTLVLAGVALAQSSVPPRLVVKYGTGQYANVALKAWDDTSKFGPVPANLRARGEEVCRALNARPEGYHPRAQDENGNTIVEGGFLCVR